MLPGKASKLQIVRIVPQTDTGGRVENTKALERTRVKQPGRPTVTSGEGTLLTVKSLADGAIESRRYQVAATVY